MENIRLLLWVTSIFTSIFLHNRWFSPNITSIYHRQYESKENEYDVPTLFDVLFWGEKSDEHVSHIHFLLLCSVKVIQKESKSYRFVTTWGRVNNGRIWIFGWINTFKHWARLKEKKIWCRQIKLNLIFSKYELGEKSSWVFWWGGFWVNVYRWRLISF